MKRNKTIGVLGGMGPEASATLYKKIISYTQEAYDAVQDFDYPPVIIDSLQLFGFDETGIVDEDLVKKQLIQGVRRLEQAGCELIIVACNTVHAFYEDMQSAVSVPIFNIIEETRKKVEETGHKKVGLFASESTNRLHLYPLRFKGIAVIEPTHEQQQKLNAVIEQVMAGKQNATDTAILKSIAEDYVAQGAESVVMGCTEIPLAITQSDTEIHLFDTIQIIVERAVDFSLGKAQDL